jgi:two-component system sensor histidine kinase UhpB
LAGDQSVGSVEVLLDPKSHELVVMLLALASLLLGVVLASMLYLLPTRVVNVQADELERAEGRLALMDLLEEERRRIARDLHDGAGQALTALQIELELARDRDGGGDHLKEARHLADETLDEIRAAVTALRPRVLEEEGLAEALRHLLERFEVRTGIRASCRITGDFSALADRDAQVVYRVIQEALTNVARHAQATEVGVVARLETAAVVFSVSDDGVGFDVASAKTGGLGGIRDRLALGRGHMAIESSPKNGTVLTCRLPLDEG